MSYLLDIFNKRQPAPASDPTANAALLGTSYNPSQYQRPMTMPSGGPNMPQPVPQSDPTANAALLGTSYNPSQQWNRPMTMPSGGPNTGAPMPHSLPLGLAGMFSGGAAPTPPINRGPGGNAQNNPMPQWGGGMWSGGLDQIRLGGGMAPSMPNAVDQGLGMQQMNFGNPMGGMNNWFSNFTAPRPMPAPAAPAPMMPMKGMFGVR